MGKLIEVANALFEEMASNKWHWSSERATPRQQSGKYDVDVVTLLANQVNALSQRLDNMGTSPLPGSSLGLYVGVYAIYQTYGTQGHTSVKCYNGSSTIEHTNNVHNFNPPQQINYYLNAPSSGWKLLQPLLQELHHLV